MIDFLRSNPWCSRDEYLWVMSVGQIRLASMDYTHVEYIDEKDNKTNLLDFRGGLLTDLAVPTKDEFMKNKK